MTHRPYSLRGCICPTEEPLGFLMPFFESGDLHFAQIIDNNDRVSGFAPIIVSGHDQMVQLEHSLNLYEGDKALYAFAFGKSDLILECRQVISETLLNRLNEFESRPFIRLDVMSFLERHGEIFRALESAYQVISQIDAGIAEKWHGDQMRQLTSEFHGLGAAVQRLPDACLKTRAKALEQCQMGHKGICGYELNNPDDNIFDIEIIGVYSDCEFAGSCLSPCDSVRRLVPEKAIFSNLVGKRQRKAERRTMHW